VDTKPLFRGDALRPRLAKLLLRPNAVAARPKLASWSDLLGSKQAEAKKETELLSNFLRDVFVSLLGYVPPPQTPYSLKREALVKVDGKFADAGFGHFNGSKDVFAAVLEDKGPRDPLDRPFSRLNGVRPLGLPDPLDSPLRMLLKTGSY
jgi:hypothetical protein